MQQARSGTFSLLPSDTPALDLKGQKPKAMCMTHVASESKTRSSSFAHQDVGVPQSAAVLPSEQSVGGIPR